MATVDDIQNAVTCLAEVYPQSVATDLSVAMSDIRGLIEKVRDPIETLRDIDVDGVLASVDAEAVGDNWEKVAAVAVGLTKAFAEREVGKVFDELEARTVGNESFQRFSGWSNKVLNRTAILLGFTPDMPYAAAQRTCELVINTCELKIKNLRCVQGHIIKLVNAVLVLVENVGEFKDALFDDLDTVKAELERSSLELARTQRLVDGQVGFDSEAFDRAQGALRNVNAVLSPPSSSQSIVDVAHILSIGDVEVAQVNEANVALVRTIIPYLAHLIEQEASAYEQHVNAINALIESLSEVTQQYEDAGNTTRLREQRARGIAQIKGRVDDLIGRVDGAIRRQAVTAASQEMLAWISRVKAAIAMMEEIKKLNYEIGSSISPVEAEQLRVSLEELNKDLAELENELTEIGLEKPDILKGQLISLARGAMRILDDLENGRATEDGVRTLHAIAAAVAEQGSGRIDDSIELATRQQALCAPYADTALTSRVLFDNAVDMLNQAGLDYGVDLFRAGRFKDLMDSDPSALTYAGAGIQCLTEALTGIDDTLARQKIMDVRDKLVASQTSLQHAAADSADFGVREQIEAIQERVGSIQRDAKQVEAIVGQLRQILAALGEAQGAEATVTSFAYNLKKLAVGAGGRLGAQLERFSEFANGGVVECTPQ